MSPGSTSSSLSTHPVRHRARGLELRDDLAFLALAGDGVVEVVAALVEHPSDEICQLGQRFGRRIAQTVVERSKLAFPLMAIETGVGRLHDHGASMRERTAAQTTLKSGA
jgi:hypothetical protein